MPSKRMTSNKTGRGVTKKKVRKSGKMEYIRCIYICRENQIYPPEPALKPWKNERERMKKIKTSEKEMPGREWSKNLSSGSKILRSIVAVYEQKFFGRI